MTGQKKEQGHQDHQEHKVVWTPKSKVMICKIFIFFSGLALISNVSGVWHEPSNAFHHFSTLALLQGFDNNHSGIATVVNGEHGESISVNVASPDYNYTLDLQRNSLLLPETHIQTYQQYGHTVEDHPFKVNRSHCFYEGQIRGVAGSWAAMSTCHGLNGAFYDGSDVYYIEPTQHSEYPDENHYTYKLSHLKDSPIACGNTATPSNLMSQLGPSQSSVHFEDTADTPRFVRLMFVVDNSMSRDLHQFYRNRKAVYEYGINIANVINVLYRPLNIFISLTGVVLWNDFDEISVTTSSSDTVSRFHDYQKSRLMQVHPHDNAQLLTGYLGFIFEYDILGEARSIGDICSGYSCNVVANYYRVVGLVATIAAHELGHNLGLEHDDIDLCSCDGHGCLMYPSADTQTVRWSNCSRHQLDVDLASDRHRCLLNPPYVCGNGLRDEGEDCDCGLPGLCVDPCCDPHTCRFNTKATCSAINSCCDPQMCQPKPSNQTCRPARGECDVAEYCDGISEMCPEDLFEWGRLCRPAIGVCDLEAYCNGSIPHCPDNGHKWNGLTCGMDSICDGGICRSFHWGVPQDYDYDGDIDESDRTVTGEEENYFSSTTSSQSKSVTEEPITSYDKSTKYHNTITDKPDTNYDDGTDNHGIIVNDSFMEYTGFIVFIALIAFVAIL